MYLCFAGHPLEKVVFTRLAITCSTLVEFAFCSSTCGLMDLCCYCGETGATIDKELKNSSRQFCLFVILVMTKASQL